MIPFFLADRPMSLRILKGLPLKDHTGVRIGIMANANTSPNFQKALQHYPCDDFIYCHAVGGACPHQDDIFRCPVRQRIKEHTVKMCDSGIFTREGATLTYDQLFAAYARMGVDYGIMIDVLQDSQATLESAREALTAYKPYQDKFTLVGVAQGTGVEEYLDCYAQLKQLGFQYVAVGGLLRRTLNTVRYVSVRSEEFMFQVLEEIRRQYPDDWLFALGCLSPRRLTRLKELNVSADYKGWIFQYKKRNETLNAYLEDFASKHLESQEGQEVPADASTLLELIAERKKMRDDQRNLSNTLYNRRRALRAALISLEQELQKEMPEKAVRFKALTTRGLLNAQEERLVSEALQSLGKQESDEAKGVLDNIRENRDLTEQIKSVETQLNQINDSLATHLAKLSTDSVQLSEDTKRTCAEIARLVGSTEQEHRLAQVRGKIAGDILQALSPVS